MKAIEKPRYSNPSPLWTKLMPSRPDFKAVEWFCSQRIQHQTVTDAPGRKRVPFFSLRIPNSQKWNPSVIASGGGGGELSFLSRNQSETTDPIVLFSEYRQGVCFWWLGSRIRSFQYLVWSAGWGWRYKAWSREFCAKANHSHLSPFFSSQSTSAG